MKNFFGAAVFGAIIVAVTAVAGMAAEGQGSRQDDVMAALTTKMVDATDPMVLYGYFEDSAELFFKDNKFDQYVQFLRSVREKKKEIQPMADYYLALTRYSQLKRLEETQDWEAYFANGNAYRDEIVVSAQKAIDGTLEDDPVRLYSHLILWRFHNDQQDAFTAPALTNLMNSVTVFAKKNKDPELLKAIADQLAQNGEKVRARVVYRYYAEKVMASEIKEDELKSIASKFYSEGNIELSEALYQAYVDRLMKGPDKEAQAAGLKELIVKFSYRDKAGSNPAFAEELGKKLEASVGKNAFDEELLYLRGYNLEKIKDYPAALSWYQQLLYRFPTSAHADEVTYKSAFLYAYALGDISNAKTYFRKLSQAENGGASKVFSLYHLGLLSQWAEDEESARGFYAQVLEKARAKYEEALIMAQDRLKELDSNTPIEYNLKMFLDASLKHETAAGGTKVSLKVSPSRSKVAENVNMSATAFAGESGCMQVELQYLWSGNLGKFKPANDQTAFTTQYSSSGVKEVELVVVSATGIVDKSFDFIDVE